MLLTLFAPFLSGFADRALRLLTGCPPAPPSFDGLLDELFARWPLDAEEIDGGTRQAA